jgi:polyribonucleotide nucleotidyltransferase
MDGGVRIKRPVAGIAMGLVSEGEDHVILSDILGLEDHSGDMDFKVAGTQKGITALQMDIKLDGLKRELMVEALGQARDGRIHILKEMLSALQKPRAELSAYAPKIIQVPIVNEKIGALIGPGGSVIRKLQEETKTKIAVDEERSLAVISGAFGADMETAEQMVRALTSVVDVGTRYTGRVVSIRDFGCFVEVLPGLEGLVHVSELASGYVENVRDVVSEGDEVEVVVINVDEQGRIKLSKKQAEPGYDPDAEEKSGGGGRGGGGGGGGRGGGGDRGERRPSRGRSRARS